MVKKLAGIPILMQYLREKHDMTQTALANKISRSQTEISYYENGSRIPTEQVLVNIAKVLKFNGDKKLLLKPITDEECKCLLN